MHNIGTVCIKKICANPYVCFDENIVIIRGPFIGAQVHSGVHMSEPHTKSLMPEWTCAPMNGPLMMILSLKHTIGFAQVFLTQTCSNTVH
jgi:hypothetical protein